MGMKFIAGGVEATSPNRLAMKEDHLLKNTPYLGEEPQNEIPFLLPHALSLKYFPSAFHVRNVLAFNEAGMTTAKVMHQMLLITDISFFREKTFIEWGRCDVPVCQAIFPLDQFTASTQGQTQLLPQFDSL